jgi:hypothetical protein
VHQDVVTAHALACLLLPGTADKEVVGDRKIVVGDRFDDLTLYGLTARRSQIKSHGDGDRKLTLSDLTTLKIDFRIDNAVASMANDATLADEYRLVVTFDSPDETLLPYLRPAPQRGPLLPGLSTQQFVLDVDAVWPDGGDPSWRPLHEMDRATFVRFAGKFVIETSCPLASGDLSSPGPLEFALLRLLEEKLGAGRPPNQHRQPLDVLAHLIQFAQSTRVHGACQRANDVVRAMGLRTDFGRVEEELPIDEHRLVARESAIDSLVRTIQAARCVAVTGPPGIGKSWLLHQLGRRLAADGWIVATHYCFVDLLDNMRKNRITVDATFGSLIAELLDADPSLRTDRAPRFAAGPRELETILAEGYFKRPHRHVAIIVDGLDHADRIPSGRMPGAAADIVQELAALDLPDNVALVVGSQPGDHLGALPASAKLHTLDRWDDASIRELAKRAGVIDALEDGGLTDETPAVIEAITRSAAGNPLYATYLARRASQIATGELLPPEGLDLAAYVSSAPPFEDYYSWLLDGLGPDTGVRFSAELLSLLDFPITIDELSEIQPAWSHLLPQVLTQLRPVLAGDVKLGGVRVYHESFQRYVLGAVPNSDRAAILTPVIDWLTARGFFADKRAFRSLLPILRIAGHHEDVIGLVDVDFVTKAARHCQPGDAVMANLATAAQAAVDLGSWTALTRLIEVSRAADYLYAWRLDGEESLAENYGRAYAALHGAPALSERLLHDGRCTFRPRPGLLLCRLCDEDGVDAPWEEYRRAHDHRRQTDNTVYGSGDEAIMFARLVGRFRVAGRDSARALTTSWLATPEDLPVHPHDVVFVLGTMYGMEVAESVIASLQPGTGRAWARVAVAGLSTDPEAARTHAEAALDEGLPASGVSLCLGLGASPARVPPSDAGLDGPKSEVLTRAVRFDEDLLPNWLTELDLAKAIGDETTLFRVENMIPSDSWFHRWLRFAVALRRDIDEETLVADLHRLSEDVDVFGGDPRVVDLYSVHDEIRASFRQALDRFDDVQWSNAVEALAKIGKETSSWLQRSRGGPLTLDAFFELCLATADTELKRAKASDIAAELLTPGQLGGEYYETHAEDQFLLVRVHLAAGRRALAERAWEHGCLYLSGYGWRKDITVYEVLDPIDTLGAADPTRARPALKTLQPIVEAVLVHTDGKETRHAVHRWLDIAAELHPAGALDYLARESTASYPSFGWMDHALPKALSALQGVLPADVLAAGWIAAGETAGAAPKAALAACEAAIAKRPDLTTAWSVVVASLAGDGDGAVRGASAEVAASAVRLGRQVPVLPAEVGDESSEPSYAARASKRASNTDPAFTLTEDAGPFQIAYAVRRWRDLVEEPGVDAVANAIGWRLVTLHQDGRDEEAETLIRRIARDTPSWTTDDLLTRLADGLARHDARRLAAVASTLAYTRARDGWRRFAGEAAQGLFLRAISLDPDLAWSMLAEEVADCVTRGGENGVTVHLIELLVAGGRIDEAYGAWNEACRVIRYRLPATGPTDAIEVEYDEKSDDPLAALGCAVAARLNHCLVDERRAASAALALFVAAAGPTFASVVDFAAEHASVSVLLAVLHAAYVYEREPYDATRRCERTLRLIVFGEYASARVLARRLLARAGLDVAIAPPRALPPAPPLDLERIEQLSSYIGERIGERQTELVEAVWPDFERAVAERLEVAIKGDELRDRMHSAFRHLRSGRKGRDFRLWLPDSEEMVRTLQTTAAAMPPALASNGVVDPSFEDAVGMILLGHLDLGVRLSLSRTARPGHHPIPSELPPAIVERGVRLVPSGDVAGWVVLAHFEQELIVGEGYDEPVEGRRQTWSGLQFADETDDLEGQLPLGYGEPGVWLHPALEGARPAPFRGPAAGLQFCVDEWDTVEILAPHPVLVLAARLRPAAFERGLVLVDSKGHPAVVARSWRQHLLGDDLSDHEHRLVGMELLARSDVVDKASNWAIAGPVHVIQTMTRRMED